MEGFFSNRLLFSLLFSGNVCGGQGFNRGEPSRDGVLQSSYWEKPWYWLWRSVHGYRHPLQLSVPEVLLRYLLSCNLIGCKYKQYLFVRNSGQ